MTGGRTFGHQNEGSKTTEFLEIILFCCTISSMKLNEVRQKYLAFFENEKRGHVIIPSASLVPENDPTTLFTGSGMQPLVPYLLGQKHPAGTRLVNSQKCFRSEDIEEVGDNRHTTFFEMLGNWSLGDYWKEKQLGWVFEFLTKELKIPKEKLWVTCFEGDEKLGLPRDTESAEIWEKLGLPKERVRFYGAKKNWWSRGGVPENMPIGEPGGADSEVFFEFTQIPHDKKFGDECQPNCDCGRFMEIGNSVFMEYRKIETGFEKLLQRNVDFGGGLERITSAVNNEPDIFQIEVFADMVSIIEKCRAHGNMEPFSPSELIRAKRRVVDHMRSAVFLISDGVVFEKGGAGSAIRRLVRNAAGLMHIYFLATLTDWVTPMVEAVSHHESYRTIYKNLSSQESKIIQLIKLEIAQATRILSSGKIEKVMKEVTQEVSLGKRSPKLSGEEILRLHTQDGYEIEYILFRALAEGFNADVDDFEKKFKKHQEISRAGAEKKFKGGLADTSEISLKYHTATHLLHQALRDVLGPEVRQKGSNITPERLRFDFSFSRKMTDEEKKKVEDIVNAKIKASLPVQKVVLPFAEAGKTGALHFFGEKYGDMISVYFIGDSMDTSYSKEFCGGPHVKNTSEIGSFKIVKEEAVSQGVRRIKAVIQ